MDKNPFGGKKGSLYTPMSEDEQEVLERLIQARDLDVIIKGWGFIRGVQGAVAGDLRLSLPLTLNFDRPDIPVPVYFFDLELRTGSGMLLFAQRQSTVYDKKPVMVGAGTTLHMVWDIAIHSMDPKVVKALKPGAVGLTSRWIDRDTGFMSLTGNVKMNDKEKRLLIQARTGEAAARADNDQLVAKALKMKAQKPKG